MEDIKNRFFKNKIIQTPEQKEKYNEFILRIIYYCIIHNILNIRYIDFLYNCVLYLFDFLYDVLDLFDFLYDVLDLFDFLYDVLFFYI